MSFGQSAIYGRACKARLAFEAFAEDRLALIEKLVFGPLMLIQIPVPYRKYTTIWASGKTEEGVYRKVVISRP